MLIFILAVFIYCILFVMALNVLIVTVYIFNVDDEEDDDFDELIH